MSVAAMKREGDVPLLVKFAKAFLWIVSWGVTIWWFSLWFRLPSVEYRTWRRKIQKSELNQSAFWGEYAAYYVMFVAPVIALAILALLYLELEEQFPERVRCPNREPKRFGILHRAMSRSATLYRAMWTQPLFVRTPVGVITFIDIVIFVIVLVCTAWIWGRLLVDRFIATDAAKPKSGYPKWAMKLDNTSDMLGKALPFTIAVLFIPVARGSPILRLIDVPFEQAVKYHRWVGYLTVLLCVVHGVTYAIYAGAVHHLELLWEWPTRGTSNLAGAISCIPAIVMGVTSIPYFRTRHFNFFFTMHHLYFVFLVFYVFHVDWAHTSQSMGPIFLFLIDRFLRAVQSQRRVPGVSASVLPSGYIELKIPRQPGFKYNALSFLYLRVAGVSRLQWHPFSTSSSPLDDGNQMRVHIKPLGDWTTVLHRSVIASSKMSGCPFAISLNVEGPYGHETNYFLRYNSLILVAGGAGVTPYLAIIQDLLKRHELQQEGLPTNVQLIWCVRKESELAMLRLVRRGYQQSKGLALDIQAYVTGEANAGGQDAELVVAENEPDAIILPDVSSQRKAYILSVNSYQNLWMIALILASSTVFVLITGMFHVYVGARMGEKLHTAFETILHFISLFVGIVVGGGLVIFFWIASDRARSGAGIAEEAKLSAAKDLEGSDESTLFDSCIITRGSRPQFQELFKECSEKREGEEVGVLICGPESLQSSVAEACRSRNFASLMKTPFHYHSVSFDL